MKLQNGHIIIDAQLSEQILEGQIQINWVFYPERSQLLFAAKSKTFFEKMHQTQWKTLKHKNAQGDMSFYVREILIDFELDDSDRTLPFEVKSTGIVVVQLA